MALLAAASSIQCVISWHRARAPFAPRVEAPTACVAAAGGAAGGCVSLIITNPPLGRRVKVSNLHALFADLFALSAKLRRPGGRLVLINPLRARPAEPLRHVLTKVSSITVTWPIGQ